MILALRSLREAEPGRKWRAAFERTWPYYRKWYLKEGATARPGYLTCRDALDEHMPELSGRYRELCSLAGGGDTASRFLSLFNPPPFMSGCTQVALAGTDPVLIRNYDYNPRWFEGMLWSTDWLQPVIGVGDCCWGLLDGMNGSGLAASLTFGGSRRTGKGFGIPLVMRYVLETCASVDEAISAFERIPVHMVYNILLVDASGDFATVFVGPHRRPGVHRVPLCSNHQETIDWPEYAEATATAEREALLRDFLGSPSVTWRRLLRKFLKPPLYNLEFEKSFGTLYTAVWFPGKGEVRIVWPERELRRSFDDFEEGKTVVQLRGKVAGKLAE